MVNEPKKVSIIEITVAGSLFLCEILKIPLQMLGFDSKNRRLKAYPELDTSDQKEIERFFEIFLVTLLKLIRQVT